MGVGLGATLDVLDASRRDADRSTHIDDLVEFEARVNHVWQRHDEHRTWLFEEFSDERQR